MSSSAPGASSPEQRRGPRAWPVLLILALCAAPVVAAWLAYFVWPPASRTNHGELVEAHPLSDPPLVQLDGGACDAACRGKLLYMRQLRLTQGKDMDRVERVWLVTDAAPVAPALAGEFPGTVIVRAAAGALAREFPAAGHPKDYIYVVDPLGNVMLRWSRSLDPDGMKRDLSRLLRASRIG